MSTFFFSPACTWLPLSFSGSLIAFSTPCFYVWVPVLLSLLTLLAWTLHYLYRAIEKTPKLFILTLPHILDMSLQLASQKASVARLLSKQPLTLVHVSRFSRHNLPPTILHSFFFFFIVVGFVIHWNESAMGLHVFPILIPPPTSLSIFHSYLSLLSYMICASTRLVYCYPLYFVFQKK